MSKKENILEKCKTLTAIILGVTLFCVIVYAATTFAFPNINKQSVYVIPIKGDITLEKQSSLFAGGNLGAEQIARQIEIADADPTVSAIILDINSGGGTVVASKEISRSVKSANKPVVAFLREIATSGAYWIAASSDYIVSDRATMTGSIGVTGAYLEFSGLMEKYGIGYERLISGQYKDIGSPYRKMTSQEEKVMKKKIDLLNNMFLEHVSDSRNLTEQNINKIKSAEPILGVEAKEMGLVDMFGSKKEAIMMAEQLSGDNNLIEKEYTRKTSWIEQVLSGFSIHSYLIGYGMGQAMLESESKLMLKA